MATMTPEERRKLLGISSGSGTTAGTDKKSAEKNLRQDYENMKADEREKKARESYEKAPGMKKGGKIKKYADGGMTMGVQQPTYPFYGNQPQAGGQNGGVNQTFNMQPQAQAGPNDQMGQQQRFKKGGQVRASAMKPVKMAKPKMGSASSRADGIASRGKTRGRMV
jgi:hypothetical protein